MIIHRRKIYYFLGFLTIGLGVNIMGASSLGVGAWDTVTFNLQAFFLQVIGWSFITKGMISLFISGLIMLMVILYRKQPRYLYMVLPIALVALSIDFWDLLFFKNQTVEVDFFITNISIFTLPLLQLLFYIIGIFILPLGLTMVVKSMYPAFVFDEWMLMIMDIFKTKKIIYARMGIELFGLLIGAVFGYLTYYSTDQTLGDSNIGSVIFTILFSTIMGMWFHLLKVQDNVEH